MMMTSATDKPDSILAGVAQGTGPALEDNALMAGEVCGASAFGALLGLLSEGLSTEAQPKAEGQVGLASDGSSLSDVAVEEEAQTMEGAVDNVLEQMMWSPRAASLPEGDTPPEVVAVDARESTAADVEATAARESTHGDQSAALAPAKVGAVTLRPAGEPARTTVAPAHDEVDSEIAPMQASPLTDGRAAGAVQKDAGDLPETRDDSEVSQPMAMEDLMAWQRAAYTQAVPPVAPRAQEPTVQPQQAEGATQARPLATTEDVSVPRRTDDATWVADSVQHAAETGARAYTSFVEQADDGDAPEASSAQTPDGDPLAASFLYQPQQATIVPQEQQSAAEVADEPARAKGDGSAVRERFAQEPGVELQEEDKAVAQAPEDAMAHPDGFHQTLRGVNQQISATQEPQAAQTQPPVPAVAVSQELSQAITHGAKRVQMRIVPEGLGELDIKVQMTGQQVHLTIRGDAPELAQLLTQKVHELRQDLQSQGLNLEAMDFGALGSGSQGGSMSEDGRSRQSQPSDDQQGGLQRLAGTKQSTSTGAPRSRPQGPGPSHRIIDVVL